MRVGIVFAGVAVLVGLSAPATGQVTYSYQGPPFQTADAPYTMAMSVDGSFDLAAPLPPSAGVDLSASLVAFSFSDGIETRTEADSLICQFEVTTDGSGVIVAWDVWLRQASVSPGDPQHSLETHTAVDLVGFALTDAGCGPTSLDPFATVTGFTGTWTGGGPSLLEIPTVAPIGLAVLIGLLVGSALLVLRRRTSPSGRS